MPEDELNALVSSYLPLILGPEAKAPAAGVHYLAREVERITRANAAKTAFECANRISNRT